ncbi:TIR domain-containing protein [Dendrosporobacter sp. 1207_IL3150]|uniref:TIR domain-containing protein n=1 Tax=Dendrosporobacter sp. 1207_IL3150 TaxID=3084054 RepID=UPI002FDA5B79
MAKTYNIFISHSWAYSDAYEKLMDLLKSDDSFSFKDYSVPKNDPIHNAANDRQLREAIKSQMSSCSVILILAGVYATYSKWINEEISLAQNGFNSKKAIIAIEPWGAERTSKVVKDNANVVVKWQTSSVINAVKQLG